jgi:hypothetical protein
MKHFVKRTCPDASGHRESEADYDRTRTRHIGIE